LDQTTTAWVIGCPFYGNRGDWWGGAVCAHSFSTLRVADCTFYGNNALHGADIDLNDQSTAVIENSISAFSTRGDGVFVDPGGSATLTCCDIYGSAGDDWVGYVVEQLGVSGSICENPPLCNPLTLDFTLMENSPCGPIVNPTCGLIGAWGIGCAGLSSVSELRPTAIPVRWGEIKAIYRR
jgi:hypothetical protein